MVRCESAVGGAAVGTLRRREGIGETVEELATLLDVMRAFGERVQLAAGTDALDTCGTGGDRACTINASTVAALAFGLGVVMLSATGFLLWQLSRVAPPYRRQGRVLISVYLNAAQVVAPGAKPHARAPQRRRYMESKEVTTPSGLRYVEIVEGTGRFELPLGHRAQGAVGVRGLPPAVGRGVGAVAPVIRASICGGRVCRRRESCRSDCAAC